MGTAYFLTKKIDAIESLRQRLQHLCGDMNNLLCYAMFWIININWFFHVDFLFQLAPQKIQWGHFERTGWPFNFVTSTDPLTRKNLIEISAYCCCCCIMWFSSILLDQMFILMSARLLTEKRCRKSGIKIFWKI